MSAQSIEHEAALAGWLGAPPAPPQLRAAAHASPLADELGMAERGPATWWAPADGSLGCAVRDVVRAGLAVAVVLAVLALPGLMDMAVTVLLGGGAW
ncbi:hypothetical protein [Micrococcus luteus]|uniref:hypothetical protein n=1 Tax=Micrococcus luteus TaxID=1270 RepID=UPI00080DE80A|nr:hypothetical protein [Micrococcus luteus]